jgi:hypothetical protein
MMFYTPVRGSVSWYIHTLYTLQANNTLVEARWLSNLTIYNMSAIVSPPGPILTAVPPDILQQRCRRTHGS